MDTKPSTEFNRSAATTRPILDARWDGRSTFSVEEARKIIGVSRSAAYAAVKSGELPAIRIAGRVIIPRHALEQLLEVAPVERPTA
jgi:excisionase family DNA binding protein